MQPTQPKFVNPTWEEFWDKVKEDPTYFDDFEGSDAEIEDSMIPNVDSEDEAFDQTQVPPKEIEEDIETEDIE